MKDLMQLIALMLPDLLRFCVVVLITSVALAVAIANRETWLGRSLQLVLVGLVFAGPIWGWLTRTKRRKRRSAAQSDKPPAESAGDKAFPN